MASSSPSVISVPEALSVNTRAGGRVSRAERRMLMRRLIAPVALAATLVGVTAPPAHAGKSTDIALGLASFAVDRKSTRLNSSHSQISYAVFCLKKKNHSRPPHVQRLIYSLPIAIRVVSTLM